MAKLARSTEKVKAVQEATIGLLQRLFKNNDEVRTKTAVMMFIHDMDSDAHILDEFDFETLLEAARKRRGKGTMFAKAGK